MSVSTEIKAAETEIVEVAKEVVAEVKEVVAKVEEKLRQEITDAEKVIVTRMENEYLKATLELQRLQTQVSTIQKNYPAYIESLAKKYGIEIKDFTFDAIELLFKKNQ